MASPIMLRFEPPNGSFGSLNTIASGPVGHTWGTVTSPFTPLLFTPERRNTVLVKSRQDYEFTNKEFYEQVYLDCYSKKNFWGDQSIKIKNVEGVAFGVSGGGILNGASKAITKFLVPKLGGLILDKLRKGVSLDMMQASTSAHSILHGLNGRDTYNLNMNEFDGRLLFINASAGCIVQTGINLVFFGSFPPIPKLPMNLKDVLLSAFVSITPFTSFMLPNPVVDYCEELIKYLWTVNKMALAYTWISDAAIGFIPPGGTISIVST